MGRLLVLYYSKKGSTRQMAEHVAEGAAVVPGSEVRVRDVDVATRDDVLWCDGIAVGSPTHLGTVAAPMKAFWEGLLPDWQKLDGRIGCAFSSQGGWGGGAELTCQALSTIMMNFGFLVFGLTDYVAPGFTAHYGATQVGPPTNHEGAEACRRLGRRLAEWVAVFVDGQKHEHPLAGNYKRNPWD
jgi:NAD(P)H dehydrogenase (quinone)